MTEVLKDAEKFFTILQMKYNIQMGLTQKNKDSFVYVGEYFSYQGKYLVIKIEIFKSKSIIQVYNVTREIQQCIFQKMYDTSNNTKALSKSVSLFKLLEKS